MRKSQLRTAISLILAAALCFLCAAVSASADSYYVENEWNYVDGSLEMTYGIPDNATGVLDSIRRRGVLRVATEPYYPPYEFIDPEQFGQKQYVGADIELARMIADRMGVELEIVPMEFTQVLPSLTEYQCDLTISAIAFTPGRASSYTMSKGYYFTSSEASTAFIIRQEDAELYASAETFTDKTQILADKTLIAQSNSLQEALVAKHVHNYKEFRRVASVQTVYEAVRQGRADAGVVDMDTARTYLRNNPDSGLMLADGLCFVLEEQYLGHRVVAKKGELQLIYYVNGVIDEVVEKGLYVKWMEDAQKRAADLGL